VKCPLTNAVGWEKFHPTVRILAASDVCTDACLRYL